MCQCYESAAFSVADDNANPELLFKNTDKRIFMFYASICLGHYTHFKEIEAKIWALALDFEKSCLPCA